MQHVRGARYWAWMLRYVRLCPGRTVEIATSWWLVSLQPEILQWRHRLQEVASLVTNGEATWPAPRSKTFLEQADRPGCAGLGGGGGGGNPEEQAECYSHAFDRSRRTPHGELKCHKPFKLRTSKSTQTNRSLIRTEEDQRPQRIPRRGASPPELRKSYISMGPCEQRSVKPSGLSSLIIRDLPYAQQPCNPWTLASKHLLNSTGASCDINAFNS